jgi:hypothetical protein
MKHIWILPAFLAVAFFLRLPVRSIAPEEGQAWFGWLAMFAGRDMPASSAQTRKKLGWEPVGPGLIADLEHRLSLKHLRAGCRDFPRGGESDVSSARIGWRRNGHHVAGTLLRIDMTRAYKPHSEREVPHGDVSWTARVRPSPPSRPLAAPE